MDKELEIILNNIIKEQESIKDEQKELKKNDKDIYGLIRDLTTEIKDVDEKTEVAYLKRDMDNLGDMVREHLKESDEFRDTVKELATFFRKLEEEKTLKFIENIRSHFNLIRGLWAFTISAIGLIGGIIALIAFF